MTHIVVQASLQRSTTIPRDQVVNTFHFNTATTTPTDAEYGAAMSKVGAFYTATPGSQAHALSYYLSPVLSGTIKLKAYLMTDAKPRAPRATGTATFTPRTGVPLPSEVALCLSFKAATISGDNGRSRRGRIYVGPFLADTVATSGVGGDARPITALQSLMADAASYKLGQDLAGPTWCVYSPHTTNLIPVQGVWIDDAWDTQRRRGAVALSRYSLSPIT